MGGCRTAMESRNPVKEKKKVHQQNFRPSTSHTPKQGIFMRPHYRNFTGGIAPLTVSMALYISLHT